MWLSSMCCKRERSALRWHACHLHCITHNVVLYNFKRLSTRTA
jgi:hypothetical protein